MLSEMHFYNLKKKPEILASGLNFAGPIKLGLSRGDRDECNPCIFRVEEVERHFPP